MRSNPALRPWKTRLLRLFGGTDRRRWADGRNLLAGWNERTRLIATLIPDRSTVLEFGAGNCELGGHLPAGCSYVPSDIVRRRPDCIVVDLNGRTLPDLPKHDVAVFSGVLEYVSDIRAVVRALASTPLIVASYAVFDPASDTTGLRRKRGWLNDWGRDAFVAFFAEAGFTVKDELVWEGGRKRRPQSIFVFAGAMARRS
ncbi:MAG: hypothetical protein ACWA6X_04815 [Bauldia sp.]